MKSLFFFILFFAQNIFSQDSIQWNEINGKIRKLSDYKNHVVLVVNIATRCGYTPQLSDLEKLYQKYKTQKFIVLGFPSNEFGQQSPESNVKIGEFCQKNYGVTFPISRKTSVKGSDKSALFKYLVKDKEIQWNFEKFLINKEGKLINRFSSSTKPMGEKLTEAIKKLL